MDIDPNLLKQIESIAKELKEKPPANYIRVGTDYFKIIEKPDRFGIVRKELKKWSIEAIRIDEGRKYPKKIPKYDDFIIEPNNNGESPIIGNCYNMHHPFAHKPKPGEWKWTFTMLKQIFGTQFKAGMIYLQVLYLYPKQALPVLVLVSKERQTGKSTFLDWLNLIFGANVAMIDPDVIGGNFNGEYAAANIIAIDETILDKQIAVEKIKALATKKFISVNIKNVQQFKLPFFGKIIMASNNEDKFMRIDDEEIRFWIRKLGTPKINNHSILNDMIDEIPAFLHYLTTMPIPDFSKSRMVLTSDQIKNQWLEDVKKESRSWLHKELMILFKEYLEESGKPYFYMTATQIKNEWFANNNQVLRAYIFQVLRKEMNLISQPYARYPEQLCYKDMSIRGAPFMIGPIQLGIEVECHESQDDF